MHTIVEPLNKLAKVALPSNSFSMCSVSPWFE